MVCAVTRHEPVPDNAVSWLPVSEQSAASPASSEYDMAPFEFVLAESVRVCPSARAAPPEKKMKGVCFTISMFLVTCPASYVAVAAVLTVMTQVPRPLADIITVGNVPLSEHGPESTVKETAPSELSL